jgi:hypothetical protein
LICAILLDAAATLWDEGLYCRQAILSGRRTMKTTINTGWYLWRIVPLILFTFLTRTVGAYAPYPGSSLPLPLDSWSFRDTNNWTDDYGDYPISFTNLSWSPLGDGSSLMVDASVPAWLSYEIYQTNVDATNIILNGPGSITFWYGPDWTTTNGGPGNWTQLIDAGQWTSDSSVGYFGLSAESSGSNLWFMSQDGLGNSYALFAPISWTTNFFHFVALTYSSTNVSLYLDGQLATNDPGGLSVWPGTNVLSGGMYLGSDLNGNYQANGMFDLVATYDYPLDSNTVSQIYDDQVGQFEINLWNVPFANGISYGNTINSANASSSSSIPSYNVVTGSGNLQLVGSASSCVNGPNAYYVWLTNITAVAVRSGTNSAMKLTFTIEGGAPGVPYDVFANSILSFATNGPAWAWEGQGYQCDTYTITNLPGNACFLVLGTPLDTLGVGLTDAYQLLVTKTDPRNPSAAGDGISNGDKVGMGLNPQTAIPAIPSSYTVQSCPQ